MTATRFTSTIATLALTLFVPLRAQSTERFAQLPRKTYERTPMPCEVAIVTRFFDANGDGRPDLFLGQVALPTLQGFGPYLLLNDGHGRLWIAPGAMPPGPAGANNWDTRAGDLDGDGDLDLVCGMTGNYVVPAGLLINDGTGRFTDEFALRMPSVVVDHYEAVALLDIDGDSDLDICAATGYFAYLFYVFENDGAGHFTDVSATKAPPGAGTPHYGQLHALDVESDGDLDLISNMHGATGGALHVYINDGTGRFVDEGLTRIRAAMPTGQYQSLAVGDIDGDGDVDFVGGRASVGYMPDAYLNDGTGFFDLTPSRIPQGWAYSVSVSLGDLDLDGDLDLLVSSGPAPGTGLGEEIVCVNDGAGYFTLASRDFFPLQGNGGVWFHHLADVDGDGDPDAVFGNVSVGSNPICGIRYFVNRTRHVYASAPPTAGSPWTIDVHGPHGGLAAVVLALREARIPLGSLGELGLDPTVTVAWPGLVNLDQAGHGTLTIPVPPGIAPASPIAVQALALDPNDPRMTHLTNTWDETIR